MVLARLRRDSADRATYLDSSAIVMADAAVALGWTVVAPA